MMTHVTKMRDAASRDNIVLQQTFQILKKHKWKHLVVTLIGYMSALDNTETEAFCESLCEKKRCNKIPDKLDMRLRKESGVKESGFSRKLLMRRLKVYSEQLE